MVTKCIKAIVSAVFLIISINIYCMAYTGGVDGAYIILAACLIGIVAGILA